MARDSRIIAVIPGVNFIRDTKAVYDALQNAEFTRTIHILEPTELACRLKVEGGYDFYVILTLECPFHPFENAFRIQCEISQDNDGFTVFDSYYSRDGCYRQESYAEKKCVCTDSQRFYDYFSHVYDMRLHSPLNLVKENDRCRFLISRSSLMDEVCNFRSFGVVFSSPEYKDLAMRVYGALGRLKKRRVMVFLKDISQDRLMAMESVECFVIVDCPFYTPFNTGEFVHTITPFELSVGLGLNGKWDGSYKVNEFNFSEDTCGIKNEDICTHIDSTTTDSRDVKYDVVNKDDTKIYPGLDGTPDNYSNV